MTKKRLPFPFRIGRGIKLSIVAGIGLLSLPPQFAMAGFNNGQDVAVIQQNGLVRGTVVDESGDPLIGVSVLVKGSTTGTVTDTDGNFVLEVSNGKTLEISYVGYLTQNVRVTGSVLRIVLKEDMQNLEEVVVVGYGTQKKANLTGAVANVNNKLLDNRPLTNLSSGLAGLLPGVQVTQTSGQPGQDVGKINIRGVGTMNNATPMVIIDGVEGSLNDVNPNDVESISVLKDAASSAIYGSKAANGVILVTTKRGKAGKITVNYAGLVGSTRATDTPKYFSSAEIAEKWNEVRKYEGIYDPIYTAEQIEKYRNGSDPENYPNTDWLGLLYRTSLQTSHNVTVSGGDEKARYLASVGYLYQDGIVRDYNKNQYSGRLNVDIHPTRNLETSWSLSYMRQDVMEPLPAYQTTGSDRDSFASTNSVYQIFRLIARISPMVVNRYADGSYGSVSDGNPIAWIDSDANAMRRTTNLLAMGSAKYYILPELSVKGTFAYNEHNYSRTDHAIQAKYRSGVQGTTFAAQRYSNYDRITFDATPEYKKSFGMHNLDALAGFHSEIYKYRYTYAYREGMANDIVTDINAGSSATAKAEGYTRELSMLSWFGRISYDYAGKYLFEINARYDGSSRFQKENRWGFFPSVSAGWRISEEPFWKGLKGVVSNMKIRASWGKLGNQDLGSLGSQDLGSYYPTISTMSLGYGYTFGGNYYNGALTYYAVNPNLKWEATTTWGIGLDANIGKFDIVFDYYHKTTNGILMSVNTPITYALSSYYDNIGKVRNSGIELALSYRNKFHEVDVEVGANVAYNKNKILDLGTNNDGTPIEWRNPGYDQITTRNWIGHRMNSFYGYKTAGYFQTQEELNTWPVDEEDKHTRRLGDVKYVDLNHDGKINAKDRTVLGSLDPSWTFGFHLNVSYRRFDLIAFFQGAADVYRTIGEGLGSLSASTSKLHKLWKDSWTPENTGAKYPRLVEDGYNNRRDAKPWIMNASYVRMKDLQIGYSLPLNMVKAAGIERARIYYSGQNLFTISDMIDGYDPETPSGRGNGYPQTIVHSIGVNITF